MDMLFVGNRGVAKRRIFILLAMILCLSLGCCHGGARSTEPAPQSGLIIMFDCSELRRQPNDIETKPVIVSHWIAPKPGKKEKGPSIFVLSSACREQRREVKPKAPYLLFCFHGTKLANNNNSFKNKSQEKKYSEPYTKCEQKMNRY
jgi:hypothetical protein